MQRSAALIASCFAALASVAIASPAVPQTNRVPITSFTSPQFGKVLADKKGQALYYRNKESRNRIRCTGSCARVWPVIHVPKGGTVPRRIAGYRGIVGTVKRPDTGRLQLTWNNRPVYSYYDERPLG